MEYLVDNRPTKRQVEAERPDRAASAYGSLSAWIARRALLVPVMIVVNVAVFFSTASSFSSSPDVEMLVDLGANYGPRTLDGQWWRLFTATWLHGGLMHLAFNVWMLWQLGGLLERLLGKIEFTVVYLASGMFGCLISLWFHPDRVCVGASGAIFGILGALFAFLVHHSKSISPESVSKLRNGGLIFLAYNTVLALFVDSIDLAGHLGGLMVGFATGLVVIPLTRKTLSIRLTGNLFAVVGIAVALFAAVHLMPSAPPDFFHEISRFRAVEQTCIEQYDSAAQRHMAREISNRTFSQILDRDVLRPWCEAKERVLVMSNGSGPQAQFMSKLTDYVDARYKSWKALSAGIRAGDKQKLARYQKQWARAEQLARELSHPGPE